ncbi:hypothetical protein GCM10023203_59440 [Actinomycetospora straminea]|uniref:Uncharacterized protein n=1 Tax=Actinomycetospora straminea TaxID=663607 RepID=A0ABP9FIN9_9PSEU
MPWSISGAGAGAVRGSWVRVMVTPLVVSEECRRGDTVERLDERVAADDPGTRRSSSGLLAPRWRAAVRHRRAPHGPPMTQRRKEVLRDRPCVTRTGYGGGPVVTPRRLPGSQGRTAAPARTPSGS